MSGLNAFEIVIGLRYFQIDAALPIYVGPGRIVPAGSIMPIELEEHGKREIGGIVFQTFNNYPFIDCTTWAAAEMDLAAETEKYSQAVCELINILWFIKDTAAHVICALGVQNSNERYYTQLSLAALTDSKGEFSTGTFSAEDFEMVEKIKSKLSILTPAPKREMPVFGAGPKHMYSSLASLEYNDQHRLDRAFYFLSMARSTDFLPLKISMYVVILESLFTTDNTEVTHKVCERVAFYIGETLESREIIYDTVKDAYDVRSGLFHGQELLKKVSTKEKLKAISSGIDELLRQLLTKILFEDAELFLTDNRKELAAYFKKLTLGSSHRSNDAKSSL